MDFYNFYPIPKSKFSPRLVLGNGNQRFDLAIEKMRHFSLEEANKNTRKLMKFSSMECRDFFDGSNGVWWYWTGKYTTYRGARRGRGKIPVKPKKYCRKMVLFSRAVLIFRAFGRKTQSLGNFEKFSKFSKNFFRKLL